MENNKQSLAADATKQVQPTPSVVPPTQPEKESNKMALWLIVGLVLIILVVGGIYWYLSKNQTVAEPTQTTTSQSSPTPTPKTVDSLNADLNSIDVPDAADDFSALDKDLQSL